MRDLHLTISKSKASPDGRHVQAIGLKIGYWPCLKAPFISLTIDSRIVDFWWGLPSYLEHDKHWSTRRPR